MKYTVEQIERDCLRYIVGLNLILEYTEEQRASMTT